MFAGPTGITVPRRGRSILGAKDEHVQVTENGEVGGRVPNVHEAPDFGEWKWPVIILRSPSLGTGPSAFPPPFAARVLVAHAPDGGFAQVFSPVYDIRVHGPDGTQKARVRRDRLGPLLTEAEVREGYEELAEIRDSFRPGFQPELVEFPDYTIPERKPVIEHIWYDDDGRLWVCFWLAEADSMHRAHLYDADGVFLHEAEWPRGIAIWHGGLSGDVAVGVRKVEFDVEQVVRLRFRPQPAPRRRSLRSRWPSWVSRRCWSACWSLASRRMWRLGAPWGFCVSGRPRVGVILSFGMIAAVVAVRAAGEPTRHVAALVRSGDEAGGRAA